MSIKNEPRRNFAVLRAIRELLEHRALWLHLLCDEAKKQGLRLRSLHRLPFAAADSIRARSL